jgi:Domain of unknown function (DUF6471)
VPRRDRPGTRSSRAEELAERLREHGLTETKGSIAAKINRGAFPATFFVAVMKAVGRQWVNLEDI